MGFEIQEHKILIKVKIKPKFFAACDNFWLCKNESLNFFSVLGSLERKINGSIDSLMTTKILLSGNS